MRQSESMLTVYVSALIQQDEHDQALELIEYFLRKQWSEVLVTQYGQIMQGDLLKRQATAEKWLKNHHDNPELLLTLGRLSQANKLWAKAEEYCRASIEYGATGEAYQVLAAVLTTENKNEAAAEIYQQGLASVLAPTNQSNGKALVQLIAN